MLFKAVVLFLAIGAAVAWTPMKPHIITDNRLMNVMLHSRAATNPELNSYCFGRYLDVLKQVADDYERNYNKCVDTLNYEQNIINKEFYEPRENLTARAKQTCDSLLACDQNENYEKAFLCFENSGSENSKSLFGLSSDAGSYRSAIQEKYRVVESSYGVCTSYCDRVYWEDTDRTYVELTSCLNGNIVEPPTTSTVPPTSSTIAETDTTLEYN